MTIPLPHPKKMKTIKVIGAGLAGCEAAYYLSKKGFKVELYDIKPNGFTPAHSNTDFGELVCSNSLKGADAYSNACGLLKQEMRLIGSITMQAAEYAKIPAGGALAVDRDKFASYITQAIKSEENITCICEEIKTLPVHNSYRPLDLSGVGKRYNIPLWRQFALLRRVRAHSIKRERGYEFRLFRRQVRQGRRRLFKLPYE